ncbi:MAG: hypothetical protein M0P91_09695 [Sulfuricurvum sp.]|jgi:hypothetical protein|uniref:hypothetical protein n=1 Tax=Sulfuricurvum sp. TaxID=2025608 RepID=UPI0025E692D6|nr:hypothetical protein [Sulfuricurvum sp.]MCK9373461.1 hypothetical protein [Sulfuricurvum sp.]
MGVKQLEIISGLATLGTVALVESKQFKSLANYLSPTQKLAKNNTSLIHPNNRKTDIVPYSKTEQAADSLDLLAEIVSSKDLVVKNQKVQTKDLVKAQKDQIAKNEARNKDLAKQNADSPLLKNQQNQVEALDNIVDVLTSNSALSVKLFGTLESNLSSISSALFAINKTITEFAIPFSVAADLITMDKTIEMTPREIKDLDGVTVAKELSPYELKLAESAANAKFHTDTNNDEFNDEDINPESDGNDFFPTIPFVGRSAIFNDETKFEYPTDNPFMPSFTKI